MTRPTATHLNIHGWCSWCHQHSYHGRFAKRLIRASLFSCHECGNNTQQCAGCEDAFSREGNAKCSVCTKALAKWPTQALRKSNSTSWLRHEVVPPREEELRSSTAEHGHVNVRALVDGHDFFEAVADALDAARECIYISLWHASDKVYLRRGPGVSAAEYERCRFDRLLRSRADAGVQVRVLLWREKSRRFWCDNFSAEMKAALEALHPNIRVLRHGHPSAGPCLWSHHQKFLVVDHRIALLGGFDVCLGRYDTPEHKLADCASEDTAGDETCSVAAATKEKDNNNSHNRNPANADNHNNDNDDEDDDDAGRAGETWNGVDYYNPHLLRPRKIRPFFRDSIDRTQVPRMPWHDVSVLVDGGAAHDVSREFTQRWNHHLADLRGWWWWIWGADAARLEPLAMPPVRPPDAPPVPVALASSDAAISAAVTTVTAAAAAVSTTASDRSLTFPASPVEATSRVQVQRSLGPWSSHKRIEQSIYGAHLRAIAEAEHYIYIENQYLSSSLAGGGVRNQIANALLRKLRDKIRARAVFRVYLVIPMPEETGDGAMTILNWLYRTLSRGGNSLLEQLHREFPRTDLQQYIECFQMRTWAPTLAPRGAAHAADAASPPPWRTTPVTEKIYVHSKVMLVDDRVAIISSANLNDRSLLGDRDSELGVEVRYHASDATSADPRRVTTSRMNGAPWKCSRFVRDLRFRLWSEMLLDATGRCGRSGDAAAAAPAVPIDLDDIFGDATSERTYDRLWLATARRNTIAYERVFPGVPRNAHRTLEQWRADGGFEVPVRCALPADQARELLARQVRGVVTLHPLSFLADEDVNPTLAYFIGDVSSQ